MKASKATKIKPEKKPTWKQRVEKRLAALEAKAGIPGEQGEQGKPGETGKQGETGAKGEKGGGFFG